MPPRSLQENFFKETDSRRSPCRRRMGPFLHPVFIYLLFFSFFLFLCPFTPPPYPSWILYRLTLTVVRASFMVTEKSSGSFLCTSLHPLCLFFSFIFQPGDIHPRAFHRKAPKRSTLCVCVRKRYGDLFPQSERVPRSLCFSCRSALLSPPPARIEGPQLLL